MNTASGEMTSASQQVQASAEELSQLADQLKAMVGRFKLDDIMASFPRRRVFGRIGAGPCLSSSGTRGFR